MQILEKKELNLTPLVIISNTGLLILLLLITVLNSGKLGQLTAQKTPTLVELYDGSSVRAVQVGKSDRTDAAITNFVGSSMIKLLSWNALPQTSADANPTQKPQLDKGVQAGNKKITTNTWAAGFALSEDFRAPFLKELSNLTPDNVFTGNTQSVLIMRHLSPPFKLASGQWRVEMVASLVIFENSDQVGRAISFNKSIFVRAIDTLPLPKDASDLQMAPYLARKAGLEIYKIQDLDLGK